MEELLKLLPGPQSLAIRYGATAAMVLVTFAVRLGIHDTAGEYGFIVFIPAIVAAGLLFDRGSGFLALALSCALVAPLLSWRGVAEVRIAAFMIFILVGGGLVLISEALHRALDRAHRAEREKDLLLQEMSHRVKNKFAMIASMVALQARNTPAPEVRAALDAIGARVRVITKVHDYLQLSRHDGAIDMRDYLEGLCTSLSDSLKDIRPVAILVTAVDVQLPPEKALPVGLIVNELVVNALKYAFPDDRTGSVHVRLEKRSEILRLSVTDDGIGCPQAASAGLGTKIVNLLAAQLGGTTKREPREQGCSTSTEFPF
jgi:two-component sensor histidine kinase